jgi:hypothetical protein
VIPERIVITFQGGFVGTRCAVDVIVSSDNEKEWHTISRIFPEDVSRRQIFDIVPADPSRVERGVDYLKLLFEESSDFFGRITVYDLEIKGEIVGDGGQT